MLQQLRLHRRNLYWVGGISALIALLAVWTFAIEWEWSHFGDDAGLVQAVRRHMEDGHLLTPLIEVPSWTWSEANEWGLFRPAMMVYISLIYQLPPDLAHLIRLIMYGIALVTPILLLVKQGAKRWMLWPAVWVLSLAIANYPMLYGLYLVSLSEMTAIFLVSLALLASNRWLRVFLLIAGALAKAPFIWLTVFYSSYLLFNKKSRAAGVFGITLGLISLLTIIYSAQVGSYTSSLIFNPWHFKYNMEQLGTYGIAFLLISIVGLIAFSPIIRPNPMTYMLLAGAIFYAGNLLPWNTVGYYSSPIWFLVVCAFATAFKPQVYEHWGPKTLSKIALTLCLLGSVTLWVENFRTDVMGRNDMAVESRDWVLNSLEQQQTYLLYNIWPHEFQFYLEEQDPTWRRPPPSKWFAGEPRPADTLDSNFAIVSTEVSLVPELTKCPPIKVWTRAFLAPLRC